MSLPPWSMQRVVRTFKRQPPWAVSAIAFAQKKGQPEPTHAVWAEETAVQLACGHIKRDPWEAYGNERAVRVRAGLHAIFSPDAERKCRCYKCKRPHP